jgi:aromatic ring-opening dioxygenase LigB subunit
MTINPDLNPGDITNDPIVNEVVKLILDRHIQGMDKFGKTMEANERPLDQWIAETIEELLDAVHYLTKAKSITDKFKTKEKLLNDLLEKAKENTFTVKDNNVQVKEEV